MKYFEGIESLRALKELYHKLAKKYHPDREGGSEAIMKEINNEYDIMFERLKKMNNINAGAGQQGYKHTEEKPETFRNIIDQLMKCDGLEIEICGYWVWLTGNTYEHRELIKNIGFKFSSGKKAWYFDTLGGMKKKFYRGNTPMDEIRAKYGSIKYTGKGEQQERLTA